MSFSLNYDDLVMLDAEDLAETGIKSAYDELLPQLKKYISTVAQLEEQIDDDFPSYSVTSQGKEYFIYGPGNQQESWGNAAFALFDIVNRQLEKTNVRFFAINSGHDLGGMFLTLEQAENAKKSLPQKSDWPYLPIHQPPAYGQYR